MKKLGINSFRELIREVETSIQNTALWEFINKSKLHIHYLDFKGSREKVGGLTMGATKMTKATIILSKKRRANLWWLSRELSVNNNKEKAK